MKTLNILLALILLGCANDPISTKSTNNPDVRVSLLFEHDGIKVYRFYDNGNYIYYTDARGRTTWNQSEGKSTKHMEVETADRPNDN